MKPVVTWILLANARAAQVYAHHGPGKGLRDVPGKLWQAEEPGMPRDRAGLGHAIGGPGVAAVEQTSPRDLADTKFARELVARLTEDQEAGAFDRLILVAGPHMLGLLRKHLTAPLNGVLMGDIPKDLSHQSPADLETHLGELIAV